MNQLHVIVQAGGRGSRLRHHTWNKPKCLVSVNGKPILYHLFDTFPEAKFLIIGDYLFDQLEKYLFVNTPSIEYSLLRAQEKGTASGISSAFAAIPPNTPTVLVWSDLIIKALPPWPATDKPVVCTTSSFTCRWTVASTGDLQEKPGSKDGIPGLFYFPAAPTVPNPPASGEFVRWFSKNITDYEVMDMPDLEEVGDFHVIEESNERLGFSRFFNSVDITEDKVRKTVIDKSYQTVHEHEVKWYREAQRLGFRRIPRIYSEKPLIMERVNGKHPYQMHDLTAREQSALMADYLDSLTALHDLGKAPANQHEVSDVYYKKTVERVRSIARLIPGFEQEALTINGRKCRNVFAHRYEGILESLLPELQPARFVPIHGDPTFSNTLIDNKLRAWFIDPRGYFAKPGIMGDAWYDFAKVYYSAIGGYDAFNRRKFKLYMDATTVEVLMDEPPLSKASNEIFKDYFSNDISRIEIITGLIWLSFSGYVKDDIDSIIGAFYMGLYWLEKGSSI